MLFRKTLTKINIPVLTVSCRNASSELKEKLKVKIDSERENIREFVKKHGKTKVGEITVAQVYGGMRDMLGIICETSLLDPATGIRFRGYSIKDCQEKLPKAKGGEYPLPEAVFWLLLTGELPTDAQVAALSQDWIERAALPGHIQTMINNFPANLHPMSQFSAAITALNSESQFLQAYSKGTKKTEYWKFAYEDAMSLIAKIPVIASTIYSQLYKNNAAIAPISPEKDWAANLASMLGKDDPKFVEFMRLYLSIHSDHEGGNVSAHAVHLVGSALSDPFLSFAAGMNGLAGPLHGRATQDVLIFINKARKELGDNPTDDQLVELLKKTLKSGQVIPGYGHAVLRETDPRYMFQLDFAAKHIQNCPTTKLVSQMFKVTPNVLKETGKVKNPWPNVDAHSGCILQYYGINEMEFYTVLFGVSRALGTMASLIWSRALGFPIERPRSITTEALMKQVSK